MSHEALINDLRRKSAARISRFRADAEVEVEKLKAVKEEEYEKKKIEILGQLKTDAERGSAPIIHEAKRKALAIEDDAMRRLAERVYALALQMLEEIREHDYETFYAELVKELPEVCWESVRVKPDDRKLAEKYFAGSIIETDPDIKGGFIVTSDGGDYQVVNTLQKRLDKGWPIILSQVLQDLHEGKDV